LVWSVGFGAIGGGPPSAQFVTALQLTTVNCARVCLRDQTRLKTVLRPRGTGLFIGQELNLLDTLAARA